MENFMRAYFLRARSVRDITQAVIEKALDKRQGRKWFFLPDGKKKINDRFYTMGRMLCLSGNAGEVFRERPETMLEAFLLSRSDGMSMSDNLKEAIIDNISLVDRKTGLSKEAARIFLEIIGKLDGLYETLDGMHKMRVLGKYLPEFGATTAMVQHDMYHKYTVDEHSLLAVKKVQELFAAKVAEFGEELMDHLTKVIMLQSIDSQWKDHLLSIDHLKEGIGLRGYGQKDPKQEYKKEAYQLFMDMMLRIREEVVEKIFWVQIDREEDVEQIEQQQRRQRLVFNLGDEQSAQQPVTSKKVGRNEPCTCGSGKKYKQCCGK